MKKVILLMLIATLGIASANAQFEKGVKRIKAQTSAFDLNFSKDDFNLNLGLEGSYFIVNNLAVHANVGFDWHDTKNKAADKWESWHKVGFGIGADYYFYKMFYGGIGFDFSKTKNIDFESAIKLKIGATYYISQNVYVNPDIYFNSGLGSDSTARFGLEMGIGVNF